MGRSKILGFAIIAAVALGACGDDDTNGTSGADAGGAVTTIHTVAALEPAARTLVNAYGETSDAKVELTVGAPAAVTQAASAGEPAIMPGPWLSADAQGVAIGRALAIIAVPAGNPAQVTGAQAFTAGSGVDTAICAPNSGYGNFGVLVAQLGGAQPDPATVGEGCAQDAIARVARGELDAALVFRNAVEIPAGVEVVSIPDEQNIVIDVSYAPGGGADSFQEFLASDAATQVLTQHGLRP